MSSALYKKILSRGYWRMIIRPSTYKSDRVKDIASLRPIVEKNSVKLRGWDFPHIDIREKCQIDLDWIGQEFNWEHYKSIWRMYQSGQFFHIQGLPIDWRDESNFWAADKNWKSGSLLGIGDTIATLTEIFEFAARLSMSDAGGDEMHIEIIAGNLHGRSLYVDSHKRWPLDEIYQATIQKYPYKCNMARSELLANPKEISLLTARELFQRFGWNMPNLEILRGWQEGLKI